MYSPSYGPGMAGSSKAAAAEDDEGVEDDAMARVADSSADPPRKRLRSSRFSSPQQATS